MTNIEHVKWLMKVLGVTLEDLRPVVAVEIPELQEIQLELGKIEIPVALYVSLQLYRRLWEGGCISEDRVLGSPIYIDTEIESWRVV